MNSPDLAAPDLASSVTRLIELLDIEELDTDLYRGATRDEGWKRVYGGQVVAQALVAASRTVPAERLCHSLHAYFIRAGDPAHPIVYKVERDRDGGSFTTRRVVALQQGKPIFNMAASFQTEEAGLSHASSMPAAPAPETLLNEAELTLRHAEQTPEPYRSMWLARERPIEFKPAVVFDVFNPIAAPPFSQNWCRLAAPLADIDPALARALFAYASDMTMLDICLQPHAVAWTNPRLQAASLDHAIWFYATPNMNDWLLFDGDSPVAGGGRGLNRALVYGADGTLVAAVQQEGLIRYRPKA
ncbi:acyl-CoA thioesterase II [Polymorphobacter multimanifer]|uniref:Acyl-CoA thioesterase 2 n=1 Tax=Polymorphobacter multimanifer TaxID=1070431 RepID=A0A841LCL6_9SPHN|nr:acyl-CoA thioesterase II [Polymorphobacter multimanifer]MBB6226728.1 acyl-CoA thioesterase-2 [Polymorphobacter multimanifer]GGI71156.1 acyl-CoA thioesterase II [Polymorphobacter multimanifer]